MLFVVIDQLFVDLVGDDIEAALDRQRGDVGQLLPAPDAAVGVVRRIEDQRLRPLRDVGAHHVRGDDEVVLLAAVDHDRRAARHADHLRIADPARRGQEHLVARVEHCAQRDEQRLLRTVGDDDFRRRVIDAVVVAEFLADLFAQVERASHGRIARDAGVDGELAGVVDVFRRVEIRFTGGEADHVHPFGAKLLRARVHGERDRRGDGERTF